MHALIGRIATILGTGIAVVAIIILGAGWARPAILSLFAAITRARRDPRLATELQIARLLPVAEQAVVAIQWCTLLASPANTDLFAVAQISVVAIQKRVRAGPAVTGIGGAGIIVVTVATVLARIYFKCVNPQIPYAGVCDCDRPNGLAEEQHVRGGHRPVARPIRR